MARIRREGPAWPRWCHAPDGTSAIFNCAEEVPSGWTYSPHTQYKTPDPLYVDEEDTRRQLTDLGVWIDPRWGAAHLKKVLDDDRSTSR